MDTLSNLRDSLRNILVEYVTKKRELVDNYIGVKDSGYIYDSDIEIIKNWRVDVCFKALYIMASDEVDFNDYDICPWCNVNRSRTRYCGMCEYGEMHGYCGRKSENTYKKILSAIYNMNDPYIKSIRSIPGIRELVKETNKKTIAIFEGGL